MKNILDIRSRGEFRQWLMEHCASEKECWITVKRGKTPPRVRIDNIQRVKASPELASTRLNKLIEASAKGEMIGD